MCSLMWTTLCGAYEVSDLGRVRSVDRDIVVVNPIGGYSYQQSFKGQVLLPSIKKNSGLLQVKLYRNGKMVRRCLARLVAEAFVEGKRRGYVVGYKNRDRHDTRASNLVWYNQKRTRRCTKTK